MESINQGLSPGLSIDGVSEIELVALAMKERAVRCKVASTGEPITFRPSRQVWQEVPGQILKIKPSKIWSFSGTRYLSGQLLSARIEAKELGLTPLKLENHGTYNPREEYREIPKSEIDPYLLPVIKAGPRPMFEMQQIIPGEDPEDPWDDPILQASDFHDCGDIESANKVMERILTTDLRCLDAHAHLGNWDFSRARGIDVELERAKRHYEVGVRIGELSLGDNFKGALIWSLVDNRPFLRCLHGFGLCLWRLGKVTEARQTFEKIIWLNPNDNQGIRYLLGSIDDGQTWDEFRREELDQTS